MTNNTDTRVSPGTLVLATVTGDSLPDGDYYVTTPREGRMAGYHVVIVSNSDPRIGTDRPVGPSWNPWALTGDRDVPDIDGLDRATHRGWWVHDANVTYVDAPTPTVTTPDRDRLTFGELDEGDVWGNVGYVSGGHPLWVKVGDGYRRHGDTDTHVYSSPGASYMVERVERGSVSESTESEAIRKAVAEAVRAERDRLTAEFEAWKERATETAHSYADDNSLCGEFDRCMEEIGLRPRAREYEVEIVQRYTITVEASDEDDAAEQARDQLSYSDPYETDVTDVSRA